MEENKASRELAGLNYLWSMSKDAISPNQMRQFVLQPNNSNYFSTPTSAKPSFSQAPEPKATLDAVNQSIAPIQGPSKARAISQINGRKEFIKFNEKQARNSPTPPLPSSSHPQRSGLAESAETMEWVGASIFSNLSDKVMAEFDKIMREGYTTKVRVIEKMNEQRPVNYEYNPNKSRIRTNYYDYIVAGDRTRNNVASRRSRQRKKFSIQMLQYSVDYDVDDNEILKKQEMWLRSIIANLEPKMAKSDIESSRKQCGLE